MSQTVIENNALCKNWVGCTRCTPWPSLRTHYAVSQAWPGRVVAPSRPCRRLGWPCRRLYHDTPSTKAMRVHCVLRYCACRRPKRCIVAHHGRVAACIAAILRYKSRPQPRYKVCIVTRPPCQAMRARAAARPARRLAISWPISWPCHAVSWAWPGRSVACCCTPKTAMSRYNSIVS